MLSRKTQWWMVGEIMKYGTMVDVRGEYIYKADSNSHVLGMVLTDCLYIGEVAEVLLVG